MDQEEVASRVTEANRKIRIQWYGENAPKWRDVFKASLRSMLLDPCWGEGELEEFCLGNFKLGECEMRELAGLPFVNPAGSPVKGGLMKKIPLQPREKLIYRPDEPIEIHKNESGSPPGPPLGMSAPVGSVAAQIIIKKKQAAERAKVYRERRKLTNKA